MDKNPFSLFDFLGYFIPGALSLYLIILSPDFGKYFEKDFFNTSSSLVDMPIYMILFYIIIAYCLGHFLSFFSTLTIEKYTRIVYNDPSKLLLNDDVVKPNNEISLYKINIWRSVLFILIWPLILYDKIMVSCLNYNHSYLKAIDNPYKSLIRKHITSVFKEIGYDGDVFHEDNNYHKFLIHYNYEFTKNHGHKLMNYVSLYGFLRVITLISCFFFNYTFVSIIKNYSFQFDRDGLKSFFLISFCLFLIASFTFIFYLGYLKFYKRYTTENLMLILIVKNEMLKDE